MVPLGERRGRGLAKFKGMAAEQLEQFEGVATIEKVASLSRRRGFVFPSSDIYGGLGSSFDFGHYGVLLSQNIKTEWQRSMIQERDDMVALDSAVILNPQVWVASGHVAGFSDPMVDCRTCKLRFRADQLQLSHCGRRPSKHPGEYVQCDLTEPRHFNLMFETFVGAVRDDASKAYLRPETAQGIFVNFKNVTSSLRVKPPFGIAQIGKSFRNEITPGNFLFRVREFEQMEMEFFVPPADAEEWHLYWIEQRVKWHLNLGLRPSHLRVRAHDADELSHYSSATSDLEYLFPIGWQELEGVANRGDYDLRQHSEASGTTLEWIGHEERYVPYVIEPAIGVGRAFLAFMCDAYDEEIVADRPRTLLRLHPRLAPVKVAVLPLVGKDSALVEKARPLYEELRRSMSAEYDDAAAIGKRYRRQDEIGTPWALTADEQTLTDGTVTLRDRDTLQQERIPIDGAKQLLLDRLEQPWRPRA
jgi:glycyl-tRNA synthetase